MIKIRKGLDVPISGAPKSEIEEQRSVRFVAVLGPDYVGMKPTMEVDVDDVVKRGQVLFTDKKNPGVKFTAPAGGKVTAVNRGAKRAFESVVIEVDSDEAVPLARLSVDEIRNLDRARAQTLLVESGLWTAFRTRPYSKVPDLDGSPHAIFVTAIDTNPLAADPRIFIEAHAEAFELGLQVAAKLTDGRVYVCQSPGAKVCSEQASVSVAEFDGPHPAGLVGTHIHFLDPVGAERTVWHLNYQDVVAIGRTLLDGELFVERLIALAGPQVERPRLVRTRIGASTDELVAGELIPDENRVISGSVLSGRKAQGALGYLGRYHLQVSVLREGRDRELFGWASPGRTKHSVTGIYVSRFLKQMQLPLTTTTNGSPRGMVPIGTYEQVMPLDILPTQLLRYLIVGDTEMAQKLGCLELDEEDLALCTYVCPAKYEYGPILRDNLTTIEKEG